MICQTTNVPKLARTEQELNQGLLLTGCLWEYQNMDKSKHNKLRLLALWCDFSHNLHVLVPFWYSCLLVQQVVNLSTYLPGQGSYLNRPVCVSIFEYTW